MRYLVIDELKHEEIFVEEFETETEAIKKADAEFDSLTPGDKKRRVAFYVLESVDPDPESDDHFDGDIVKSYK